MSNNPDRLLALGQLAELGLLSAELVHELRQPVFAVKAMAQILRRRLEGEDDDLAQLDGMLQQLGVAEEILDRYAVSGRRPTPRLRPTPLAPPVEAGVALLQHRARSHQKQLEILVGRVGPAIDGDPVSIQQITANLVANALYAARHRVEVRVSGPLLEVLDDGPGIPQHLRDRIFEPFFSTKPPGRGTGLGLAITHHLVTQSGGEMDCDSGDRGTLFSVRFRESEARVVPAR